MKFPSARGPARKRQVALATALSADIPTGTLSAMQTTQLAGGAYAVGNNEWGSSAPESIATDGTSGFTVTSSSIRNVTNGAPGGYPSIYSGCHWGNCTRGGLGSRPVPMSALTRPGTVRTSWN